MRTRALVQPALARDRRVLPLAASPKRLRLAMVDPLDLSTLDDVRFSAGRRIDAVVASGAAMDRGLARAYGEELAELVGALPGSALEARPPGREGLEEASRSAPVVRPGGPSVRTRRGRARERYPHREAGRRRARLLPRDGLLREVLELPPGARGAVLSRIDSTEEAQFGEMRMITRFRTIFPPLSYPISTGFRRFAGYSWNTALRLPGPNSVRMGRDHRDVREGLHQT